MMAVLRRSLLRWSFPHLFLLLVTFGMLLAPMVQAACPPQKLRTGENVVVNGDSILLVVHASSKYDPQFVAKRGVDEAVAFAREMHMPVVYLEDEPPEQFHYTEDCAPDYWVYSEGGEIPFPVGARHVYIAGGHLELCLSLAANQVIEQWAKRAPGDFKLTFLMDAIYSNGHEIEEKDPYFARFESFITAASYGRPAGELWPKVNLLETMGIIGQPAQQMAYLKRVLPRWDRTFAPEYQVELKMEGWRSEPLRRGPGLLPKKVVFEFVNSAMDLNTPFCTPNFEESTCLPG